MGGETLSLPSHRLLAAAKTMPLSDPATKIAGTLISLASSALSIEINSSPVALLTVLY